MKNSIPKLYRNKFFETALWAFVTGLMITGAYKREVDAVKEFIRFFNLQEDDVPLQTLLISYHRRKKEFRAMMRQDSECIYFPEHESIGFIYDSFMFKAKFDTLDQEEQDRILEIMGVERPRKSPFCLNNR